MTEREDQQQVNSPLVGERGSTEITDSVVSKLAGIAAGEVEGVRMGGSASRAAGGLLGSVTGSQGQTRGVSVEVGRVEAAIDLTMGVEYGRNILELVGRVRARITEQVENLTGLKITELNVTVSDIIFPDQEGDGEDGRSQGRGQREGQDQGRGEIEGGAEQADRPRVRRTEEYRIDEYSTEGQERYTAGRQRETVDASNADTVSDATTAKNPTNPIAPSNAGSRTGGSAGAGDREEVRVEGDPLDEDETRELRIGDEETDETRRISRDDETGREGRRDR